MVAAVNREIQAIVLLLVGGAALRITASGTYLNYVKESMRPWLLLSGGALVLLGVLVLVDIIRSARRTATADRLESTSGGSLAGDVISSANPETADETSHAHAHPHGPGGPRSAWLLLLPVFAIFLVAPPALGAYTAARGSTNATPPAVAEAPPLPPGALVDINVNDYVARAVWDEGLTLQGRRVRMTGFATPNPAGGWWLTRLTLTCCAADAVTSRITPLQVPDLPANTWVSLVGAWVPGGGTQSEQAIPKLKVQSLTRVSAPSDPYE